MQSEIAQLIANELKVIITPEEKQIIEKTSTTSLTAYDLYLEANEYQKEYSKKRNLRSYHTAVNLYMTSIEVDSTFAKAYTGLARAYYDRYYWPEFFTENFLDSCLVLANIALSIDDKLDEAYYLKGLYYQQNGNLEEALRNYDRTIEINPNFYLVYIEEGYLYTRILYYNVKGLENYHKALKLVSGDERLSLLRTIGTKYADLGFFEKAKYYFQEALALDNNQVVNLINLGLMEFSRENYDESLILMKQAYQMDTTRLFSLHFYLYASGHHEEEANTHAQKLIERSNRTGVPVYYQTHRIGYIY
jgi:tetratricopeptide (TPR) repeat protein